jgi:hypothetical protein
VSAASPRGCIGVTRLGDHLDIGLALQHQPQRAAYDRVVVGQDDGDSVGLRFPCIRHGPYLSPARPRWMHRF